MRSNSKVYEKAFSFAIQIIELYKHPREEKQEYVLSKQLIRSGTGIGANIKEALSAQSKKDFIAKLYIASKEASETEYWIELLIQTADIDSATGRTLLDDLNELQKILSSIILTTKQKYIDKKTQNS